jgi:hypothetical protein
MKLSAFGWTDDNGESKPSRFDWGLLPPKGDFSIRIVEDITGGGTGHGSRRSRSIGVAQDEELERALRLELQAQERPDIANAIDSERYNGNCILALSGGRGWKAGQPIGVNSSGAAARAARYLWQMRGIKPSVSSLEEAASASSVAMAASVKRWDKVKPEHWENGRLARYVFRVGWRAAFRSMVGNGSTGDRASEVVENLPLACGTLEVEQASLDAWARQCGVVPDTAQEEAWRAMASFVWRALVWPCRGRCRHSTRAARQRARLLIRLLHGQTFADASRLAGYASARAAVESLRSGKVFATLREAAARESNCLPGMVHLLRTAGTAGRAVRKAIRTQRCLHPLRWPSLWSAAVERRKSCIEWARLCQARLHKARTEQALAWERAVTGWRRGWLR